MKKMSFIEAFLVTLTSFFTEAFKVLRNIKSNFNHLFSRDSNVPIIRMFHEALKAKN